MTTGRNLLQPEVPGIIPLHAHLVLETAVLPVPQEVPRPNPVEGEDLEEGVDFKLKHAYQ